MMLAAAETLLNATPPAWLRKREAQVLMAAFASAFEVEPPDIGHQSAISALKSFREFSASCMEAAQVSQEAVSAYRQRLRDTAYALGKKARLAVPVRPENAFKLVQFFYRGIGIDVSGNAPGDLRFGPCSFAERYNASDCQFMSAFDEGFICGVMGIDGPLVFSCRLTQGASCCRAHIG